MATKMLLEKGHLPVLLGKREGVIDGLEIQTEPSQVEVENIDTVTMYVNPMHQEGYKEWIQSIKPQRVIFNPGTVNPEWMEELRDSGIEVEAACTLVLLGTNQF